MTGLRKLSPNRVATGSFIYKEGVALMLVNIFEGTRKEVEKIPLKQNHTV